MPLAGCSLSRQRAGQTTAEDEASVDRILHAGEAMAPDAAQFVTELAEVAPVLD